AEAGFEKFIGEIFAPERAVLDARLGHRTVEIEHADKAGPGSTPVRHSQNWSAMGQQSTKNVMTILPDAFGDDEWGIRIEFAKNFHAHLLGIDEAMLLFLVERMRADNVPAFGFKGFGEN